MTTPADGARLSLCLSGGGFRASLFHIGVLAALAEREMLHRVEALSTVSGGSIIGAYYYLKVKQLLEGRRPGCPQPTPELYRRMVREIETEFLAGVQRNIRLRLLSNPFKNFRLAREDYSRSDRLAELLNEHFYDAIAGQENIRLRDIFIRPKDTPKGSDVDVFGYNKQHQFKIPVLVLNATCLNTGHPWQFTGAYVGEPAQTRAFIAGIDNNVRMPLLSLQTGHYLDHPGRALSDKQQKKLAQLTLADAVASSAAVPGVFPPLAIHDLYENSQGEEIVIELADGGVYDNQGVDALYDYHCTHFVISDACGQLEDERILGTRFFQVARRGSDVMMDVIRGENLYRVHSGKELQAKLPPGNALVKESGIVAYALMHLRQTFPNTAEYPYFPPPTNRPDGLVYRLANLRTDLDSFSDAEAKALMYDGYCLAHDQLGADFDPLCASGWRKTQGWDFLAIRDVLRDPRQATWLHKRLKIGSELFFKPFMLTAKAWVCALLCIGLALPALWWVICWLYGPQPTAACFLGFCAPSKITVFKGSLSLLDIAIAVALLLTAFLPTLGGVQTWLKQNNTLRWLRPRGLEIGLGAILGLTMVLVAAGACFYRVVYDKWLFQHDGRLPATQGK